jgi:hypothetical protein
MYKNKGRIGSKAERPSCGKRSITLALSCLALFAIISSATAQEHNCDFIAFRSQDNLFVSDVVAESVDFTDFLKDMSHPDHLNVNGYGVVYYNDGMIVDDTQKFYVTDYDLGDDDCYHCGESGEMNDAIDAIQEPDNHARIVLGHARNGTGGVGNHPFTYDWNGKTYSLQHNGFLSPFLKELLLNGMDADGWFDQYNPLGPWGNWEGHPHFINTWIDSELLFFYLMTHIIDESGDVVAGLRTALTQQSYYGYNILEEVLSTSENKLNFVLSDGESIFVFRNRVDSTHELSVRTFDSGIVGVATRNGNTWNGDDLPQYSLSILPTSGSPIILHDFLSEPGAVADNKRYHNGSNWVCFPIVPTSGGPAVDDFFAPLAYSILMGSLQIQDEDGYDAYWDADNGWFSGGVGLISSLQGYKVNISEGNFSSYQQLMEGEERIAENTLLSLQSGVNYVPYFLEDIQHPSEAFPQSVLDVLTSIQSEYWFMIQRNGEFVVKKECGDYVQGGGPTECYTLEYGAMYQVSVSGPVSFRWNQPSDPPYPYEEPITLYYDPEKKPDYTPVVIEEMENGDEVLEIAAFKDGDCVGAEVVDGFPVNLQVYTDDLSGVSYEAVTSGGTVQLASAGDSVAPAVVRHSMVPSNAYRENGAVFMSMQEGAAIPLSAPVDFRIESTYPNPFNPATTLHVQLDQDVELSLGIYNLQGQQVAMLFDGLLLAGTHELSWSGEAVSSGVYYAVLTNGQQQSVKKLLLLK